MSFAVALGILIALEFSLGVSAFALAKQNRLSNKIAEKMRVSLEIYDQPEHEGVTKGEYAYYALAILPFYYHRYISYIGVQSAAELSLN